MTKYEFENIDINNLLARIVEKYSALPAFYSRENKVDQIITYEALGHHTSEFSKMLIKKSFVRGDKVAIFSESRPEWAFAFFSVIAIGGVVVPLDIKLSEAEITFILHDSGAKFIFVSESFIELFHKILLNNQISMIPLDIAGTFGAENTIDQSSKENLFLDDTALIVYTSGTTGVAKGVEITYRNLLFEVMAINEYIKFTPKDRFLSILPLNHMLELTGGLIAPLYSGASIIYCDSLKPPVIMKTMKDKHITTMICVPLVLKMFHNGIFRKRDSFAIGKKKLFQRGLSISKNLLNFNVHIGKLLFRDLHKEFGSHLRCFVSGGAPLDPQVEEDFRAFGFNVLQGYGLTETSPVITVNTFSERKYTSAGIPLKGVKVKILKQQETDLEGEILVKGPNVMKGYYNNKEKTDEVIKDSWLYTGDIGHLDDDGFLYITGRIKSMIVLGGGKKVFPEEIEEVMSKSNLIKEMCVIGKKAEKGLKAGTEEVFAVIVPNLEMFTEEEGKDNSLISAKILAAINTLSENLAEYKRISDFMLYFGDLPRTSTKKVKRKEVLERIVNPV